MIFIDIRVPSQISIGLVISIRNLGILFTPVPVSVAPMFAYPVCQGGRKTPGVTTGTMDSRFRRRKWAPHMAQRTPVRPPFLN